MTTIVHESAFARLLRCEISGGRFADVMRSWWRKMGDTPGANLFWDESSKSYEFDCSARHAGALLRAASEEDDKFIDICMRDGYRCAHEVARKKFLSASVSEMQPSAVRGPAFTRPLSKRLHKVYRERKNNIPAFVGVSDEGLREAHLAIDVGIDAVVDAGNGEYDDDVLCAERELRSLGIALPAVSNAGRPSLRAAPHA